MGCTISLLVSEYREKQLENIAKIPKRKAGEFKQTEEAKIKISNSQKGRWIRENGTTARRVVQLDKDGLYIATYGCILSAAEAISPKTAASTVSAIIKCCRHRPNFKTCKGFVWLYESEYLQQSDV